MLTLQWSQRMKTVRDIETVTRETLPTASFSLKVSHIRWVAEQSIKRGISKSELIRSLIDREMEQEAA